MTMDHGYQSEVSRFRRPMKRSTGSKYKKLAEIKAQARDLGWGGAAKGEGNDDDDDDETWINILSLESMLDHAILSLNFENGCFSYRFFSCLLALIFFESIQARSGVWLCGGLPGRFGGIAVHIFDYIAWEQCSSFGYLCRLETWSGHCATSKVRD